MTAPPMSGQPSSASAPETESAKPDRRLVKVARTTVDVAAVLGLVCVVIALICLAMGLRPVVLVSGSMAPAMPVGTVVITQPVDGHDIQIGDVLTVESPASAALVTHRVEAIEHTGATSLARMRGDANPAADAELYDVTDQARRAVASIPHVGRLLVRGNAPLLLTGAAALTVIALLPSRRPETPARARHRGDKGPTRPSGSRRTRPEHREQS